MRQVGQISACGPTLPTWALQQVVGYPGYTGRDANVDAKAARDPQLPFEWQFDRVLQRTSVRTSWSMGSADQAPSVGGETVEQTIAACGDQVLLPTAPRDMR
jgi:hypothetical protein